MAAGRPPISPTGPPTPVPVPQTEATWQLRNPNSKASSRKENTVRHTESFEAGCEFSLWLTAVWCTKAEAGQMAVTVAKLSLGCGPTGPMISWESMGGWLSAWTEGLELLNLRSLRSCYFLWIRAPQHEPSGRTDLEWWALLSASL